MRLGYRVGRRRPDVVQTDSWRIADGVVGGAKAAVCKTARQRCQHACFLWFGGGAEGQNRTGDTMIFSHVLYRLSYLGT